MNIVSIACSSVQPTEFLWVFNRQGFVRHIWRAKFLLRNEHSANQFCMSVSS
jgi:hypothetical protein